LKAENNTSFRVKWYLGIISILISHVLVGQSHKFKVYSVKDGLSQNYIYALSQSKRGNLLIGTSEGLNRFDNKEFLLLNEEYGLNNNFIHTSLTDSQGDTWLGHFDGEITLYRNQTFIEIPVYASSKSPINTFFESSEGDIWVGTKQHGLIRIQKDLSFQVYAEFNNISINAIIQDNLGNLYIGTEQGLAKYSFKNKVLSKVASTYKDYNVQCLFLNKRTHELYCGTNENGLQITDLSFDQQTQDFLFKDQDINRIVQDREDNLFISSFGNGVFKVNHTTKPFGVLDHYQENNGLHSNYIKSLLIDRENNVWMGSFGNGLAVLTNPIFSIFTQLEGLSENHVQCITKDENQTLWVSSGKSINYSRPNTIHFEALPSLPVEATISSLLVVDSTLYIATQGKGIWIYSIKKKKYSQWFYNNTHDLANTIHHLVADKNQNIWFATEEGAYQSEGSLQNPKFMRYTMQDGLAHNKVHALYCDSQNRIWFATRGGGLSVYQNQKIETYPTPLQGRSFEINCFAEDRSGGLWIGTYGQGIYLFQDGKYLKKYTEADGLRSPYCYFIQFDNKNHLWIGHQNGLSHFIPQIEIFDFFESKNNNVLGEITNLACIKDHAGKLWIGTNIGLTVYNPRSDKPVLTGPIVNLSGILLNLQKTDWAIYTDSIAGFDKIPYNLILPHNRNHLTFQVNGVSLKPDAESILYQYRLNGFEKEWSLKTNEPFITYANLPPGKYTLQVRAGTKNGIWTEMKIPYHFDIEKPFWLTWWFITIAFIGLILLVISIIYIRTDKLKQQRERLRKDKTVLEAEIKQRKIAQEKQKLVEEKLKQTNQELNNFIYRSSHDLRGPVSTVKGLVQLGTVEVKDSLAQKFFGMILDRTNVLDNILKNLINIVEIIEGELTIRKIDIKKLINEVIEEIGMEKRIDDITFKINIEESSNFYNDSSLVKTVLYSIIENAVKYRKKNVESQIFINISFGENQELKGKFSDNGIGIPKEVMPRIYDMFYRGTDESKGSGLGLYTSKKILTKLKGTIDITSKNNIFTIVEIVIPRLFNVDITNNNDFKSSEEEIHVF
jgi:ligand-binding sensor domain-containing protein/signal transduction histidine kinase